MTYRLKYIAVDVDSAVAHLAQQDDAANVLEIAVSRDTAEALVRAVGRDVEIAISVVPTAEEKEASDRFMREWNEKQNKSAAAAQ